MAENLERNASSVQVQTLDWVKDRASQRALGWFDLVLFSDAIYTERGAFFLAMAIGALISPNGKVIGALPDTRNGIDAFEDDLAASGFTATPIAVDSAVLLAAATSMNDSVGLIVPEALDGYRLVQWERGG